jgi:hypothetical protein
MVVCAPRLDRNIPQEHARRCAGSRDNVDGGERSHGGWL